MPIQNGHLWVFFGPSKVGWSFGTRVGYQFADKFEINLGVAYSRKIYNAGGDAYTMEGGWYDKEPETMDAKCDVIEIPLSLSYYVNGFRNSGFLCRHRKSVHTCYILNGMDLIIMIC